MRMYKSRREWAAPVNWSMSFASKDSIDVGRKERKKKGGGGPRRRRIESAAKTTTQYDKGSSTRLDRCAMALCGIHQPCFLANWEGKSKNGI